MILDQSVFFGMADIPDRHRDMRLDVDNMSYEVKLGAPFSNIYNFFSSCTEYLPLYCSLLQELLALEERIGNVSTGLGEETISSCLKQRKYSIPIGFPQETEPCCICQVIIVSFAHDLPPFKISWLNIFVILFTRRSTPKVKISELWNAAIIFTPSVSNNG